MDWSWRGTIHYNATILPNSFHGDVALYVSKEAAGTWSVAKAMGELENATVFVAVGNRKKDCILRKINFFLGSV